MTYRYVAALSVALLTGCHGCQHEDTGLQGVPDDLAQATPVDLAVLDAGVDVGMPDLSTVPPDLTPPPDLKGCTANAFMGCVSSDAIFCNGDGNGELTIACGAGGCLGGGGCGQCTPSTASCDAGSLLTCDAFGRLSTMDCVFGCSTTNGAHCLNIVPSNGWVLDCNTPTGTLDLVLTSSGGWLSTENGAAYLGQSSDEPMPPVMYDSSAHTFHLKSLHIPDGTWLGVGGSYPLVLLVDGDVQLDGVISVAAYGSNDGPGATTGMGDGMPGRALYQTAPKGAGGGGGSYSTIGGTGAGGTASFGPPGSVYPSVGDPTKIVPLFGGAHGGAVPSTSSSGRGGGGGAIQIVACGSIMISSTGLINAGGGGAPSAGAGGGSGGAILLEAAAIEVTGVLAAAGGSGGGGSVGGLTNKEGAPGWDAPTDTQCITVGGAGATGNGSTGGTGGLGACGNHEATDGTLGVLGTDPVAHGGGGGGGGRIRINALSAPTVGPDSITPSLPACFSTGALVIE